MMGKYFFVKLQYDVKFWKYTTPLKTKEPTMKSMENLTTVMFSHMNATDKKCNKFIHLHPL